MSQISRQSSKYSCKSGEEKIPVFTQNLWRLLHDETNNSIIDYHQTKKNVIVIKHVAKFQHTILPRYYKMNSLKQYFNHLERYGFKQIDQDPPMWHHPKWERGNKECLREIVKLYSRTKKYKESQPHHMRSNISITTVSCRLDEEITHREALSTRLDAEIEQREALEREVASLRKLVNRLIKKEVPQCTPPKPFLSVLPVNTSTDNLQQHERISTIDHKFKEIHNIERRPEEIPSKKRRATEAPGPNKKKKLNPEAAENNSHRNEPHATPLKSDINIQANSVKSARFVKEGVERGKTNQRDRKDPPGSHNDNQENIEDTKPKLFSANIMTERIRDPESKQYMDYDVPSIKTEVLKIKW